MSILIATPMYGGMCTAAYFKSALQAKEQLVYGNISHDWLVGWNESLITRARNSMAATFLESDYQKLLFIDADIEFDASHIAELWNMQSDVAVGCYAMKKVEEDWYAAWVDGALVKDLDQFGSELVEVDYAGTGFMMIDRSVLEALKPEVETYEGECEGVRRREWAFFDTSIEDDTYLSEDYFFCKRVREQDTPIMMHPQIRLKHWGSYAFGS